MFRPGENSLPTRYDCTSQLTHVGFFKTHSLRCEGGLNSGNSLAVRQVCQISYKCKKYHHVHKKKQISTENFDLTLVYTVSQLTLSMDIFDGLCDRYDALVRAFCREDKKEIDRLKARELEGYRVEIEGNGSISSR